MQQHLAQSRTKLLGLIDDRQGRPDGKTCEGKCRACADLYQAVGEQADLTRVFLPLQMFNPVAHFFRLFRYCDLCSVIAEYDLFSSSH